MYAPQAVPPKPSRLPRFLFRTLLILLGLVIAVGIGLWFFVNSETGTRWARDVIQQRFPDVASITPAALNAEMQVEGGSSQRLVVLDVRTPEEQATSTLPNALCVNPDSAVDEVLKRVDRTQPVVVYCAAGYRAATLARKLNQAGFTQVRNLEGGIFAWANQGYSLEKDGVRTTEVHPYSSLFSRMLKKRSD